MKFITALIALSSSIFAASALVPDPTLPKLHNGVYAPLYFVHMWSKMMTESRIGQQIKWNYDSEILTGNDMFGVGALKLGSPLPDNAFDFERYVDWFHPRTIHLSRAISAGRVRTSSDYMTQTNSLPSSYSITPFSRSTPPIVREYVLMEHGNMLTAIYSRSTILVRHYYWRAHQAVHSPKVVRLG